MQRSNCIDSAAFEDSTGQQQICTFQRKVQFLKEKGKSKIIKYHTKLLLPFSNNVGWMTNFENTNQLFQSSVKTVWCSSEIFKNMKVNLK